MSSYLLDSTLATNALRSSGDVRVPATSLLRHHVDVQQFNRITLDPEVMCGKPCICGMRVTVGMIVEAMSTGRTVEELLAGFPCVQDSDIREALAFAARLAQGHEIRLASECTFSSIGT